MSESRTSSMSSQDSKEKSQQPDQQQVGILSRTFSSSHIIRWILPGRIRSPQKNDVVFVGETFVQLREFLGNGQLADATAKLDFGTQILSAKIISAQIKIVPVVDALLSYGRDQEQYIIQGRPVHDDHPPQILVLSTFDNELIYLYAKDDSAGDTKFLFAKRPLYPGLVLPDRQCRHMAVDHDSRALAIASSSGYVVVFSLRTIDDVKSQVDGWEPHRHDSFQPWHEQRFIQIDGTILKMEFLRSLDSEPSKVLLLLLVDSGQETHQLLYKWDTRYSLEKMRSMSCSGRPLKDDRFPLMLIPSTRPYCFLVVMNTGISYYENVHTHEFKRINCRFMKPTAGPLVWVQWAKPRRHLGHLEKRDDLFIVREDGMLQQFLIEKASNLKFNMNFTVGYLDIHVDTAFCMLAGPPGMGGDIIIAAGDMTEGGIYHLPARSVPTRIQTIPNLAPIHDMIIGPQDSSISRSTGTTKELLDKIYLCGGKDEERGEISEIRYGMEAQMIWTMDCPDATTIDQMFSIEVPSSQKLLLIASHTTHTTMIIFDLETQESEFADSESLPQFDFNSSTLAVTLLDSHKLLQVTRRGVAVVDISSQSNPGQHETGVAGDYSQAEISDGGDIALVTKVMEGYEVSMATVDDSESNISILQTGTSNVVFSSHEEVTSLCHAKHGITKLLIVGTNTGRIIGYFMLPNLALEHAYEYDLGKSSNFEAAPISSLAVLSQDRSKSNMILCGLRNGLVVCLRLTMNNLLHPNIAYANHYQLGQTTVQIIREKPASDARYPSSALLLCQSQLRRFTLHQSVSSMDYSLNSVWLTNRMDPAAPQPQVNAAYRIPQLKSQYTDPGGLLVCAENDELYFASLVTEEQTLAMKRHIDGIPRRMFYSNLLKKFIIAVEKKIRVDRFPIGTYTHPTLLDQRRPKSPTDNNMQRASGFEEVIQISLHFAERDFSIARDIEPIHVDDKDERVNAIIEWQFRDGDDLYSWIVMALSQNEPDDHRQTGGRVIAVNAKNIKKGGSGSVAPKVLHRNNSSPVTALCAYGISSLLFAVGNELLLFKLHYSKKKSEIVSRYTLPSPAKAISCQSTMIFVATSHHSLIVLFEQDNILKLHKSDIMARNTTNVVTFGNDSALFSSFDDRGTHLVAFTGFNHPSSQPVPIFQADMPLFINQIRLQQQQHHHTSNNRHRFYGSTTDGTIYHFSTLKHCEWKLLHFLEEQNYLNKPAHKPAAARRKRPDGSVYMWQPPMRLTDLHVHGDRLLMMIESGPYNLRRLLRSREQLEQLNELCVPVFGETEDPLEALISWLRKILSFSSETY